MYLVYDSNSVVFSICETVEDYENVIKQHCAKKYCETYGDSVSLTGKGEVVPYFFNIYVEITSVVGLKKHVKYYVKIVKTNVIFDI